MDTFVLNAITQELQQQICPAKITRIAQPDEFSVTFVLRAQGNDRYLAMSVHPQHQYLFLTGEVPEKQVLNFGKFLQIHIQGGIIRALHKPLLERIVTFEIVKQDIDGSELTFQLILEIMGRYSNLILVNRETNKILDSIKHVTAAQSSYRRIAPGAEYVPPPPQEKVDPTIIDQEKFKKIFHKYQATLKQETKFPFWKFLVSHFQGFSPLIAKDIAGKDDEINENEIWLRFVRIVDILKSGNYPPTVVIEEGTGKPTALSAVCLQTKVCTPGDSMNQAAEQFYRTLIERERFESLRMALLNPFAARLAKLKKKREHLLEQQAQIANAEQYKQQGDLITANIYQLTKGMRTAQVIDYYTEGQPVIEIELDPRLTPSQNAQRYFKLYNKLKQGRAITLHRLQETEQEIAYLEELKFFVEEAESVQRLEELQDEFQETEKPTRKKTSASKEEKLPFLRFVSSNGFDIYVGRSSKENDLLTQRTAQPDDIWLHVQNAPGSHVLILKRDRNTNVPEQTLIEAASLAAYYSKLRKSGKVDVIYTPRKYVKKPKGSPPGRVTVSQFQTIRVSPKSEITPTIRGRQDACASTRSTVT